VIRLLFPFTKEPHIVKELPLKAFLSLAGSGFGVGFAGSFQNSASCIK
jgi:hypothetical protein